MRVHVCMCTKWLNVVWGKKNKIMIYENIYKKMQHIVCGIAKVYDKTSIINALRFIQFNVKQ